MKTHFSILVIAFLLLTSCTKDENNESTGFVFGIVTSITGNSPIAGVIVQCNGKTYTTGSDGYYKIEEIQIGNNQLIATKTDFETYSKTVNVKSGGTEENINMVSNIVGASVWGYVRKNSDGSPISGASVTIAGMTDNTDASGRYQLPSIPQGNQNIQVIADGYEIYNQSFYMYSSDKQIDINLRRYYDEEISIYKDNYWSNFSGTGLNNEWLFTGQYMGVNNRLYFSSNINIPTNSEVTALEIQLYIEDNDYTKDWDWFIAAIKEDWDELNVTQSSPWCNSVLNASYVSFTGYYITISIIEAYINNKDDFLNYGFRMETNDDMSFNWTSRIASSEHNDLNKRPKIKVTYLY